MIDRRRSVVNAAMIVMFSVILSRLTGYIRETKIPNKFGLGLESDSFTSGFLLPDLMFQLILGGAIAAAIIPAIAGFIKNKKEKEGWVSVSSLINTIIIFIVAATILGIIFTPELLNLIVKDHVMKSPEHLKLTVNITRTLFPSVAFLMLAGICNGVLNGYHRFAFAAYGPVIYNIFSILSIEFLSNNNKADYYGVEKVAYGVMISSLIYFIIQLLASRNNLRSYKPIIKIKDNQYKKLVKLAVPALMASSIYQINVIITNKFGSTFAEGTIQALRTGNTLWQMPLGIIAQGIGIALLPSLSEDFASNNLKNFKSKFRSGFSLIYFLVIPSAIGIYFLNNEIIEAFVKFKETITNQDVIFIAGILLLYTPALIGQAGVTFINRTFYSMKITKLPLYSGLVSVFVNILLCYIFIKYTNMGAESMALAYSISVLVNFSILVTLLTIKMKGLIGKVVLVGILKTIIASVVMVFALQLSKTSLTLNNQGNIMQIILLSIVIIIGCIAYFGASILIKNKSAKDIIFEIKSRLPFIK